MASQLLPVAALLFGAFLLLAAGGLQGLLLPLRAQIEGFGTFNIGVMGAMYSVGFVAGCLLVPRTIGQVGHIRTFSVMAALAASTVLVVGLLIHPLAWILLRILTGYCFAGASMVVESWLNARATNATRGTLFSIYIVVNLVAITLGQMLVALSPPGSATLFAVAAILFCFSLIPTALTTAGAPGTVAMPRLDLGKLYRISPVGVVACFVIGLVNGSFGTMGAIYASAIGLGTTTVALFMSAAVVAGAITQFPFGRLSDRIDRRLVLIVACLGASLTAAGFVLLAPVDPPTVILLAALFGGFVYVMYALAVAHANDFADPSDFVATASGLLLVYGLGAIAGPILAGGAMAALGDSGLFAFTAAAHIALILFTAIRMVRRSPVGADARGAFVVEPGTATVQTVLLDPRAREGTAGGGTGVTGEPKPRP